MSILLTFHCSKSSFFYYYYLVLFWDATVVIDNKYLYLNIVFKSYLKTSTNIKDM